MIAFIFARHAILPIQAVVYCILGVFLNYTGCFLIFFIQGVFDVYICIYVYMYVASFGTYNVE